jgi:hypothetical protein
VNLARLHRPLLLFAVANLAALVPVSLAMFVDDRLILGINPWIKPAKFLVSVAIYFLTLSWMVPRIEGYRRVTTVIAWVAIATMVTENVLIIMQSARGTTSHFNIASLFDAMVFQTMGVMILFNTMAIVWLLVLFKRSPKPMPRAQLTGIRLGLLLFIIGGLQGGMMVTTMGHSVGVPEGGPGLPFVNWSTEGGDLRSAHFVGLHALQVLPLLGWVLSRSRPDAGVTTVRVVAIVWVVVFSALTWLALSGTPLLRL